MHDNGRYEESHNYLQLRRWKGIWFLSLAQTIGAGGGLLVGLLWAVSRQPGALLFVAVPLLLLVLGAIIGTESGGVILIQQWVYVALYGMRCVLKLDLVPVLDEELVTTDTTAFYCEERVGDRLQWSHYQPGAVEEGA